MRFADLNPRTMPGYGDPETWGGRTPYCIDPPDVPDHWYDFSDSYDNWTPADDEWLSLSDMIDAEPELDHEGHPQASHRDDGLDGPLMCECELDWNCPLHRDRMYVAADLIADAKASLYDEREPW